MAGAASTAGAAQPAIAPTSTAAQPASAPPSTAAPVAAVVTEQAQQLRSSDAPQVASRLTKTDPAPSASQLLTRAAEAVGAPAALTRLSAPQAASFGEQTQALTLPTAAGADTLALAPAPAPANPIEALLQIPATLINAAVNTVVSFFEPIVGPGTPLDNPLLWGVLAFVRRQTGQSLANSTPVITSVTSRQDADPATDGVLVIDIDAADQDNDTLTYSATSNSLKGTITASASPDTFTYTPNADWDGQAYDDTVTVTVSDASSGSHIHAQDQTHTATDTITIRVPAAAVNDVPSAVNDAATVAQGGTTTVAVLDNDTDADGTIDATTVVITQRPSSGTASVNADGTIKYVSNGAEVTSDSFSYTVNDNTGATSNTAAVSVTVTPVNDAPSAVNDAATVAQRGTTTVAVLANDTDADGTIDATTVVITQRPSSGTASVNADGTIKYISNGAEVTSDSFSYTVNDNTGATSNTATVSVTVTPVNDAPVVTTTAGATSYTEQGAPRLPSMPG